MLTQSPNYLTDFDQKHGIIDLHSILFRHFDFGLVLFILRTTSLKGINELLCIPFELFNRF